MKTRGLANTLSHLGLFLVIAAAMVGCAKEDKQTVTTAAPAPNSYQRMSNGACYNMATGQQAPDNYCNNSSGYTYVNGVCYGPGNQPVNASLCSGTGMGVGQVCNGMYAYATGSGYAQVECYNFNGQSNCRGYTLYEFATGRTVTCQ